MNERRRKTKKRKRFKEEQIIGVLKENEAGVKVTVSNADPFF